MHAASDVMCRRSTGVFACVIARAQGTGSDHGDYLSMRRTPSRTPRCSRALWPWSSQVFRRSGTVRAPDHQVAVGVLERLPKFYSPIRRLRENLDEPNSIAQHGWRQVIRIFHHTWGDLLCVGHPARTTPPRSHLTRSRGVLIRRDAPFAHFAPSSRIHGAICAFCGTQRARSCCLPVRRSAAEGMHSSVCDGRSFVRL